MFSFGLHRTRSLLNFVKTTTRKQIMRKLKSKHLYNIKNLYETVNNPRKLVSHAVPEVQYKSCGGLTVEDVHTYVQLQGTVMYNNGIHLLLKDKSGCIRLVVRNSKTDLLKWASSLEKYSYLKVIGYVVKKPQASNTENKNKVDVLIESVISVLPPRNIKKDPGETGNNISQPVLHDDESLKCYSSETLKYFLLRSHTTEMLTKDLIGSNVKICGWVKAIEGSGFVLEDGYGSILVSCSSKDENGSDELQKVGAGSFVFVNGEISPLSSDEAVKNGSVKILAESLKVVCDGDSIEKERLDHKTKNVLEERGVDVNQYTIRTHHCGELNETHVGQNVQLFGWVEFVRMNKFILLKDKYGSVQISVSAEKPGLEDLIRNLALESVISVEGVVCLRPPKNENKAMKTGKVEVLASKITIINRADNIPFLSKGPRPAHVSSLWQYRYLDIRQNPKTHKTLIFRCEILHKMRRHLIENMGFIEVETPTLFKRTPGGAQEFIVPTRNKNEFYALVQSPQQFKQILMVGGIDRYFQIARCYRDETTQKERQPEFTQLDIELSFCNREGVLNLIEDLIKSIWPENLDPLKTPFPRLTYEEVMNTYGSDKPDLRFEWKLRNLTDIFKECGTDCGQKFNIKNYMYFENFACYGFVAPQAMGVYNDLKEFTVNLAENEADCKILCIGLKNEHTFDKTLKQLFIEKVAEHIKQRIECDSRDVVFLGVGPKDKILPLMGRLRHGAAENLEKQGFQIYQNDDPFNFLWVVDFPLFEEVNGKLISVHHPFTQPHPDDVTYLDSNPLKVRGLHYDLVLNGCEIGGGSMRIIDAKQQQKVLEDILKLDTSSLTHLLEALSYGAPIHGGFALGIDRFIALLSGTESIRDVIAFPKSNNGRDPLSGAPSDVTDEDKKLYHISVTT